MRFGWSGWARRICRAGRLDEASTQAQQALDFARAHQERGQEAYALRLLGEIAVQREPPEADRPQPTIGRPLPWPKNLACVPLQAHCHRGLGTLYSQMERLEEARTALPRRSRCTVPWR